MKRFRFRLESILDIRNRAEEEIKKELAKKNGEIIAARRRHEGMCRALESFFAEEKEHRLRVLDLMALRLSVSYHQQLKSDAEEALRAVQQLGKEKDAIRQRLAQARKETRVLEILKEKRLSEWKKEYKAEEQKFVDDVSQKGYIRRIRTASRADA
jgi:flagellar FliJ protein